MPKVGVGRVWQPKMIMTCTLRFDLNGVRFELSNPNDPIVPSKDSDEIVLKSFAETMIEQFAEILIDSLKKRTCLSNIEMFYDEKCVLIYKKSTGSINYQVKMEVL
jgi:uncharacterized protein YajQ (UPF0234 family)